MSLIFTIQPITSLLKLIASLYLKQIAQTGVHSGFGKVKRWSVPTTASGSLSHRDLCLFPTAVLATGKEAENEKSIVPAVMSAVNWSALAALRCPAGVLWREVFQITGCQLNTDESFPVENDSQFCVLHFTGGGTGCFKDCFCPCCFSKEPA